MKNRSIHQIFSLLQISKYKGFTLIELLVVLIIIGILSAVGLPNLIKQIEKGRQSEAKSNLGAINRAQQAYRLEKGVFGTIGNGSNGSLPIKVSGQFYVYSDLTTNPSATFASQKAMAVNPYDNEIKDYTSAVEQNTSGAYSQIVCEANDPTTTIGNPTNTSGLACDTSTSIKVGN